MHLGIYLAVSTHLNKTRHRQVPVWQEPVRQEQLAQHEALWRKWRSSLEDVGIFIKNPWGFHPEKDDLPNG